MKLPWKKTDSEQPSRKEVIASIEKSLEQLKLENRIQELVEKYGHELKVGMKLADAYAIIIKCLEDGFEALNKLKKKVK